MDVSTLPKYDMETDISQMEAPTFTTIDRYFTMYNTQYIKRTLRLKRLKLIHPMTVLEDNVYRKLI